MTSEHDILAIEIARASEQLRQERETFEQQRTQDSRWFFLRLVMGYASITGLLGILCVSAFILYNANAFTAAVVTAAGGALFVDALGLFVSVWKGVVNPATPTRLGPVTRAKSLPAKPNTRETA